MSTMRKWAWSLVAVGFVYLATVGGWLVLELSEPEPYRPYQPPQSSIEKFAFGAPVVYGNPHGDAKTLAFELSVLGVIPIALGVVLVICGKGKP